MAFFLNRKLKKGEKVIKSLSFFYGIGDTYACYLCGRVGLNKNSTISDLTRGAAREISRLIYRESLFGIELQRLVRDNIKLKIKLKGYHGYRHIVGLPVNGQRTKNNRKTARKLLRQGDGWKY